MLDYFKLWIHDRAQIKTVLDKAGLSKEFSFNEAEELIGIQGRYKNWKIKTLSPACLQIAGSIHKYWNNGTNENDFTFADCITAINQFCNEFELNPTLAFVKNLEFGLNLQLPIDASEIIDQIICYNNLLPMRPYRQRDDFYFIEFAMNEYYIKVYDKGKQYQQALPDTLNTLRIEVKAIKNRILPGIITMADLQKQECLQALAVKFASYVKGLVFDDNTINPQNLNAKDGKLYLELRNPRNWQRFKRKSTSSSLKKKNRFKSIVESHGSRHIYTTINMAINDKIWQLSSKRILPVFTPNTYTVKPATLRHCISCDKDITQQQPGSRFCSAKYVGETEAKRCRNLDSNARNNRLRKIDKINSKGVLFAIEPFVILTAKKLQRSAKKLPETAPKSNNLGFYF